MKNKINSLPVNCFRGIAVNDGQVYFYNGNNNANNINLSDCL